MSMLEDLVNSAERDYEGWKQQARFYGTLSSVVRVLLIISTALVAAERTLGALLPDSWKPVFPVLSVLVAIGTALDAWLKPREKWKGFLADRDAVNHFLIVAKNTKPDDSDKISQLFEQFRLIEQRHADKNVY